MPSARAWASAGASGLLEITTQALARSARLPIAARIARMLLPPWEARKPSFRPPRMARAAPPMGESNRAAYSPATPPVRARGYLAGLHREGADMVGDVEHRLDGEEQLLGKAQHGSAQRPVEPKPPAPRVLAGKAATRSKATRVTGATTSWAMRSPRRMVTGSLPRLARMTRISPR